LEVFVPKENAQEAALVEGITVYSVSTLKELVEHLDEKQKERSLIAPTPHTDIAPSIPPYSVDFSDVRGQERAKRALTIAAAGGHNVALWGPPSTGKTLLARALAGIIPPLSFREMLEVTSIHSIAGTLSQGVLSYPPFRAPHHTSSYVSLVGGGTVPKPGEITLAHRGILFLDEFPEFDRRVIEALREPLEERVVSVSRARASAVFPADALFVAALNPCPCGKWGSAQACTCTPHVLAHYQRKLSGPVADRIDLWVEVAPVLHETLSKKSGGETSDAIRGRVSAARALQERRFSGTARKKNSDMTVRDLDTFCPLAPPVREVLNESARALELSARAYHRIIKIARTIADIEGAPHVETPHVLEALQYRPRLFYV
jgi:magnesium chelatase family protein